MKKFFISHSTKDNIGEKFVEYLESIGINRKNIFCSSHPDTGIDATKNWFPTLFEEIRKCDTVILIVTPNYMRSSISLLEAGAALGANKQLQILAFPHVDLKELQDTFVGHQFIDFSLENCKLLFEKNVKDNILRQSRPKQEILNDKFDAFLEEISKHQYANPAIPPISLRKENESLLKPCIDNGITRITLEQLNFPERLENAQKIRILTTTGAGFFRQYNLTSSFSQNPLYKALKRGCDIEILLGNPSGVLFEDVEKIEKRDRRSLDDEFKAVIKGLNLLVEEAAKNQTCGKVSIGNVDASLRQTVILVYNKSPNAVWGWTTITLPPARCNTNSLSFELERVNSQSIIKKYENYFEAIWEKAEARKETLVITGNTNVKCFRYEGALAVEEWKALQARAESAMIVAEERKTKKILIECAAQHPLNFDSTPGKEFEARLNHTISLYKRYKDMDWDVKIYVPGSRHKEDNGYVCIIDKIPLCEAGKNYLISQGVPHTDIFAEDKNEEYKGKYGVYCSADECFVSSEIFKSDDYQRFISVCAPGQAMRKALYYLLFGVLPIIDTAAPDSHKENTFHNYAYEATQSIPQIIATMNDMQNPSCEEAIEMRKRRNPDYEQL